MRSTAATASGTYPNETRRSKRFDAAIKAPALKSVSGHPKTPVRSDDRTMLISPTMWFKHRWPVLGDFEQLVLLGVLRLEARDSAYGAAIRQEIHARSGRDVSINAVYTTLDRLESKGLLKSWVGDSTP